MHLCGGAVLARWAKADVRMESAQGRDQRARARTFDESAAGCLSACHTRPCAGAAIHSADTAACSRLLLACAPAAGGSAGAGARGAQRSAEGLVVATRHG